MNFWSIISNVAFPAKFLKWFGIIAAGLLLATVATLSMQSCSLSSKLKDSNNRTRELTAKIAQLESERAAVRTQADKRILEAEESAKRAIAAYKAVGGPTTISKKAPTDTVSVQEYNTLAETFQVRELELLSTIDKFSEALEDCQAATKSLLAEREVTDRLLATTNEKIAALEKSLVLTTELLQVETKKKKLYQKTTAGAGLLALLLLL